MKKISRIFILLIILTIMTAIPAAASDGDSLEQTDMQDTAWEEAADPEAELTEETIGSVDNDALLYEYIEEELGISDSFEAMGSHARDNLSPVDQALYDYFAEKVSETAAGNISSTKFTVSAAAAGICDRYYSASDLGISAITDGSGEITDEAKAAFASIAAFDLPSVFYAIRFDNPGNIFWMGLSFRYTNSYALPYEAVYKDGEYVLHINTTAAFSLYLSVSSEYADTASTPYNGNYYAADTTKITSVNTAINNAGNIVDTASSEGLSDMDTLNFYFSSLKALSSYNYEAAANGGYGDPWQIIYMFDGDPSTKVVCEGYAKSFQYLCDMTDFDSSDISCISVSGIMTTGTWNSSASYHSGGAHMWNILHMEDGNNYLVDITNCSPESPVLFLKEYSEIYNIPDGFISYWGNNGSTLSEDTASGYSVYGNFYHYVYDAVTTAAFSASELSISGTPYGSDTPSETFTVLLDPNGGEVTPTSLTYSSGALYGELPVPERAGYTFKGWFTETAGGTQIDASSVCSENITLYARWELYVCTVYFVPDNGEETITRYVDYGEPIGELPEVTNGDNTFLGWYDSFGLADAAVITADTICRGDSCYYARWQPASTAITSAVYTKGSGITLNWKEVSGASGYIIKRCISGGSWTVLGSLQADQGTTFTDTDIAAGSVYLYRVYTYNDYGECRITGKASAKVYAAAAPAVSKISLYNAADGIKIKWSESPSVTGYLIYRSTGSGDYEKIKTVYAGTASWTDTSALTNGTLYKYRIKAFIKTSAGTYYTPVSGSSVIRWLSQPAIRSVTNSSSGMYLKWSKVSSSTGYYIYRSKNGGSYSLVKTITSGSTVSWTDTAASVSGAKYSYYVRAYKTVSGTTYLSKASKAVFGYRLLRPSVKSLKKTSSGWTLSWDRVSGASGYYIYRSINGGTWKKVKTVSSLTWTDTKKGNSGDNYSYRIYAYKTVNGVTYLSAVSAAKSKTR